MKEKSEHEILYYFYLHSDLIEEAWSEYKTNPSRLKALNLNNWILASFHIYEDVAKILPGVLGKTKIQGQSPEDSEYIFELKKLKLSIQMDPVLSAIRNRSFPTKQNGKKNPAHRNFWEFQKEIVSENKGPSVVLLEETAKNVIRFNNELELEMIEYYGFNYRKKLTLDIISK